MVEGRPESEVSIERLHLGFHTEDLPDLVARLGDFATGHYLQINGVAVASDAPEISIIEATKFNSDLVTWFSDPTDNAIKVAVITRENITTFARKRGFNPGNGELIINKLLEATKPSQTTKQKADFVRGVLFYANSDSRAESTFAAGIKADRLQDLLEVIRGSKTNICGLGQKSIDTLSALAAELYSPRI